MDGNKIPPTGPITLRLNLKYYEELAAARKWVTHAQHSLGTQLSIATISRVRDGEQGGPQVIAAVKRAFPDADLNRLTTIVRVGETAERAA